MAECSWGSLNVSVKNAVKKILVDEKLDKDQNVVIRKGSDARDGYASNTYAITLTGSGKTVELFVKHFPIETILQKKIMTSYFNNEERFYNHIYPVLQRFQGERKIDDAFADVPKAYTYCCGSSNNTQIRPIIMENIKLQGYDLCGRDHPFDETHLDMGYKALAKFHATAFALKDQKCNIFKKITNGITDSLILMFTDLGYDKVYKGLIDQVIESLDPVEDEDILKISNGLSDRLVHFICNIEHLSKEYTTILHGDCWANNMMFLCKDSKPMDIKIIDWQYVRVNYPVFDLAFFFYNIATSKMLENCSRHLQLYYKHFSEHSTKLGSDPNKVYPFQVFLDQWRKYSKFGLITAFEVVKCTLFEEGESPNFVEFLNSNQVDPSIYTKKIVHQTTYNAKMKELLRYFVSNDMDL